MKVPGSTCSSCGAGVVFAHHYRTRKRMIFDATPTAAGEWTIRPDGLAEFVPPLLRLPADPRFTTHFATCPNADEHRKAKS